jgi:hypothetical protein
VLEEAIRAVLDIDIGSDIARIIVLSLDLLLQEFSYVSHNLTTKTLLSILPHCLEES